MKKPLKMFLLTVLFSAVALTAFFVFVRKDRSLVKLQENKTIRIGYAVEAPFAFLESENEVTGQSPELAKRIAGRLGIEKNPMAAGRIFGAFFRTRSRAH